MNLELKELIFQASHKSSFSFSGTALEYVINVQHAKTLFKMACKEGQSDVEKPVNQI